MAAVKNHNDFGFELTVSNLRRNLNNTIGIDLIKEGFTIDSRLTTLKRKTNTKNEIQIELDCYDYKPSHLEFRLALRSKLKEIENEAKKFYDFLGEQYTPRWTIMLTEGDFHPKSRLMERKLRKSASHGITDEQSMNVAISDCRTILNNEIIPQLSKFSDLEKFQDFVLDDFDSVIRLDLFLPSIIAAKLKSRQALIKLVDYLWIKKALDSKGENDFMKKLVANIIPYADLH